MHDALGAIAAQTLDGPANHRLRFFVLGATGRTGVPFVSQALERGHAVTTFVRDSSRLPGELRAHPALHAMRGELDDEDAIQRALQAAQPDVLVSLLASETAPYNAVSTGTRSVLHAVRALGSTQALPFFTVASWGLGASEPYIDGLFARTVVGLAKRTFWAKPYADFARQLADVEQARVQGLVRPTILLPPRLASGPATRTYQAGEPRAMQDVIGVTSVVSRGSLANLCLKLAESPAPAPSWVAVAESRRSRLDNSVAS